MFAWLVGYIVPNGILNGIRNVHSMFRGYQQHDTQEFLRCFMDQLHEELKEQTPSAPEMFLRHNSGESMALNFLVSNFLIVDFLDNLFDDRSQCSSPTQSLSEAEYETCDSGVSEQSSLSDETPIADSALSPTLSHSTATAPNVRHSRASSPSTSGCSTSPSTITYQRKQVIFNNHRSASSASSVISGTSTINGNVDSTAANAMPAPTSVSHRSIISDIFDGKLLSSVQCLTCDRVSTREETFQDLSLPIPGKEHMSVLHSSSPGMPPPMPPMGMQMSATGSSCSDAVCFLH